MAAESWYQITNDAVFARAGVTLDGLTPEEAEARLKRDGMNRLDEVRAISAWRIFFEQFMDPLIYILLIAGVVTVLLGELVDTAVILAVVLINSVIGTVQRARAEKAIASLKELTVPVALVRREGIEQEIDARLLVQGDLVILHTGVKAPADMRLFEVAELAIDESALTGESAPVEKSADPIAAERLTPGDQRNMAFMGTVVTDGSGAGIVTATGMRTQSGQISSQVTAVRREPSPLERRIHHLGKLIGMAVIGLAMLVFLLGLLLGEPLTETLFIAVSVTVAAIPEGLPVVVTIALAVGVWRMAQRNAIIRKLAAVETLGSCTAICSDKTGTLTENQMTLQRLWVADHTFHFSGVGYAPHGEISDPEQFRDRHEQVTMALRVGTLCNESNVYEAEGEWRIQGDPTEAALQVAALKIGIDRAEELQRYPRVDAIPFKSERQYMATLHRDEGGSLICLKGSVERILRVSHDCYQGCALSNEEIAQVAEEFSAGGLRVLALAVKRAPQALTSIEPDDIEAGGFTIAGLTGILDPPRAEAADAVRRAQEAGIHVAMITGDHALTAVSIAQQLGIGDAHPEVLTGSQLEVFTDEELAALLPHIAVFARTSPQHKFRLVRLLRQTGEVVAVTGDGVNDAPALRAADIGLAMGKMGSDVAKEAADMVLSDDNFATIVNAVEEGRIVFLNIRKVVLFLATTALGLVIAVVAGMLLGQAPFIPSQILWMNMAIGALTDVALATEPGEPGLLKHPPRPVQAPIITRRMWRQIALSSVYRAIVSLYIFFAVLHAGGTEAYAQTMAVNVMVLSMLLFVLEAKSLNLSLFKMHLLNNRFLFFAVLGSLAAQLAFVYLAPFHLIFHSAPLSARDWGITLLLAAGVIIIVEIDKWIERRSEVREMAAAELPYRLPAYLRKQHGE